MNEHTSSIEMERLVLGACFDSTERAETVLAEITHPLVFADRNHQMMWCVLQSCDNDYSAMAIADRAKHMSFVEIEEQMGAWQSMADDGALDRMSTDHRRRTFKSFTNVGTVAEYDDSVLAVMGGFALLAELQSAFLPSMDLSSALSRLLTYYDARQMARTLEMMSRDITKKGGVDRLDEYRERLTTVIGSSSEIESTASVNKIIDEILNPNEQPEECGTTGIMALDMIAPFARDRLVMIGGSPGAGKTALIAQYAVHSMRVFDYREGAILMASIEMPARKMLERFIATEHGVSFNALRDKTVSTEDRKAIRESQKKWAKCLRIVDRRCDTAERIVALARRHKRKYGDSFHTLIVDHVHCMTGRFASKIELIDHIAGVFMSLKRELNINIIALAQNNSDGKNGRPSAGNIKYGGSLYENADAALMLYCEDPKATPRAVEFIYSKNRYGEIKNITLAYEPAHNTFRTMGQTSNDNQPPRVGPLEQRFPPGKRYYSKPSGDEDLIDMDKHKPNGDNQ